MTHSDACTAMVAEFEGCELTAYQDGNGIWTIGYGHTGNVAQGDTITQEEALDFLSEDMVSADNAVNLLVNVPLTQSQFDALVSFAYNVGSGHLESSTLLRLLNANDFAGAANQFLVWDKIAGEVSKGLLRRRTAERAMFLCQ